MHIEVKIIDLRAQSQVKIIKININNNNNIMYMTFRRKKNLERGRAMLINFLCVSTTVYNLGLG